MIAVLTTIAVAEVGPEPTAASEAASASSSAWRVASTSADRRLPADQLRESRMAVGAVPEQPFRAREQIRREASQALLGAELEERIRLEPRLLRLPVLACAGCRDDAVERGPDDVEVGGGLSFLPLGGEGRLREFERLRRPLADGVLVGDADALRRRRHVGPEGGHELVDAGGCGRVALDQPAVEVCEGLRRAVAERHRLLDLERERHAPVGDAAAVLDRDEREEAEELSGAADLLRRREGCRAKGVQCLIDPCGGALDAALVPRERRRR